MEAVNGGRHCGTTTDDGCSIAHKLRGREGGRQGCMDTTSKNTCQLLGPIQTHRQAIACNSMVRDAHMPWAPLTDGGVSESSDCVGHQSLLLARAAHTSAPRRHTTTCADARAPAAPWPCGAASHCVVEGAGDNLHLRQAAVSGEARLVRQDSAQLLGRAGAERMHAGLLADRRRRSNTRAQRHARNAADIARRAPRAPAGRA